ncbi:MAG: type II toxin-antitoxin system RelE/ParE family toxin, partial [Candidatus Competibacteraceae bacterium]|nr:type II toxin-antitoxin system RelE/ParE family toxin [Candidatus Competibacteraceae bacterium]
AEGKKPFSDWLNGLRDVSAKARIRARLNRVRLGNFGDAKLLTGADGIAELRLDIGPGYRVYYAEFGSVVVVLFCGGDKSTQRRDVAKAKQYWNDFKEREHG